MLNVCVIGAGASGLVAMKELKDEGHRVTCFEKYPQEGGVFYYSKNKGGVYDSTLLTISNYFMAFSSLPPEEVERKYWTHTEYADYLKKFAKKFDLLKHIQFETTVLSVEVKEKVIVEIEQNGTKEFRTFDAIAICTGTHQKAKYPELKDQHLFKGQILHSENYKNAQGFANKKVICVGMGESAAEIVHEIAQVASECTLSIRQYPTIVPRYYNQHTNDAFTSRIYHYIPTRLLNPLIKWGAKKIIKTTKDPIVKLTWEWGLKCAGMLNIFLTKNEIFLHDINENKLQVNTSGIQKLSEKGAMFNDNTHIDADIIMCNTGYQDDFSFLKGISFKNVKNLYKHAFHPELGKKVAFIGWARPAVGGVPPCSEMQSRYFALLCSGKRSLPDKAKLYQNIAHDEKFEEERFRLSCNIPSLVHYTGYMDSMAKLIGCMPPKFLLFRNPKVVAKIVFGSQISNQYRLTGPHSDPVIAKEVISKLPIAWGTKIICSISNGFSCGEMFGIF